jgi:hypothetical protein
LNRFGFSQGDTIVLDFGFERRDVCPGVVEQELQCLVLHTHPPAGRFNVFEVGLFFLSVDERYR